ncbi:PREDICTED: uncharacterized protein LOC104760592 [Camelina sativa]|uniref:Uncharacterized protein LOC104760592 n=1 Tax=Camelina sativa TaxID=90675 RepID=A0ABM0X7F0_CAMSA|nr:PREDICTED: uncharacterized protein LOC104760592 [Camelina sativa]
MQARKPIFAIYAISVLVLYLLFIESPKSVVPDNNSPFKRGLPLSRTDDPVTMSSSIVTIADCSDHYDAEDLGTTVVDSDHNEKEGIGTIFVDSDHDETDELGTIVVDSDHDETDELGTTAVTDHNEKEDIGTTVVDSDHNEKEGIRTTVVTDHNEKEELGTTVVDSAHNEKEDLGYTVVDSDNNEKEEIGTTVVDSDHCEKEGLGTTVVADHNEKEDIGTTVVDSDHNEAEDLGTTVVDSDHNEKEDIGTTVVDSDHNEKEDLGTTVVTDHNEKEDLGTTVVNSEHNEEDELDPLVPPRKAGKKERIEWFRRKLPELEILKSTSKSKRFHSRVLDLHKNNCSAQFFMVWLSPAKTFGPREMLAVDTLFTTNPGACLAILSNSLDSPRGYTILKPLFDRGFNLIAVTIDIPFLVKNTPAEAWLKRLKSGRMDPGSIPLFMNLSDLTRLAVLYKYGGVYLDTDIIFLDDITRLRNAIGAQSMDPKTKTWSRLNNAVMVFDIYHLLMREFLHEYSTTFDGNIWGHNSPYLVSRVITRLGNKPGYNFTIFPPDAFYPVNWINIPKLFKKPATRREAQWVKKTVQDMSKGSYMIHLWNKVTRKIKIEEGSVMYNLISTHCTVCRNIKNSHILSKQTQGF